MGSPAPRMIVQTIDGETIDFGSLYGKKAVYLKFWATWCTPCRQQMPHFEHAYETAGEDLAVIAINVGFNDSVAQIQKYRRALGITMPIVFDDGRLGAAFHLRVTPQHVVIGKDGRIQYVGHLADTRLDAALVTARQSGSEIAVAGSATASAGRPLVAGDRLPLRSVTTLDGKSFALRASEPSRPTVLVFLSPWCESYLATTRPAMSASCRRTRGLWASADDLQKYRDNYQVRIPLTLDESGVLFRHFGVIDVPTVMIADRQGKLVRRLVPKDPDTLRKAIAGL